MDAEKFHVERNKAESEIRNILNNLSIEFKISLEVSINSIDITQIADARKKSISAVVIRGVV